MDVRGPRGGYTQYYPWEKHKHTTLDILFASAESIGTLTETDCGCVSFYLEFPLLICVTISSGIISAPGTRDSGDTDMILAMCQGVAEITRGYG